MALTIKVTKVSVDNHGHNIWYIILNLRCIDGADEVINKDFSTRYEDGDDAEEVVRGILDNMQEEIDMCKAERQIFNAPKLTTAVTWVENNLVG